MSFNPYFQLYEPYSAFRANPDTALTSDILKAINGEYSAIACYEQLAKLAPNESERRQILEIQKDEKRHLQLFRQIYTDLTGKQPSQQITETCPNTYRVGLDAAFRDEQETVDFYLGLSDRAQNIAIRDTLRRIAADEQNHAVWFLYFLGGNRDSYA